MSERAVKLFERDLKELKNKEVSDKETKEAQCRLTELMNRLNENGKI